MSLCGLPELLKWIFRFYSATFDTTRFENCALIDGSRLRRLLSGPSWRSFTRAKFDGCVCVRLTSDHSGAARPRVRAAKRQAACRN